MLNSSNCGSLSSNVISIDVADIGIPVIEVTPGTTVCSDDTITLHATGGIGVVTYSWIIGGTVTATGDTYNATPGSIPDGTTVELFIISSGGCTSTIVSEVITVVDAPAITIDSNAAGDTICAGESISITATDTLNPAGPATYTFRLNGSPVNPADVVGNVYTTSSIVSESIVSVIIENAAGCTQTATLTIHVPVLASAGTISATAADLIVCKRIGWPIISGVGGVTDCISLLGRVEGSTVAFDFSFQFSNFVFHFSKSFGLSSEIKASIVFRPSNIVLQ